MSLRTLSFLLVGLWAIALAPAARAQSPVPATAFTSDQTKAVEQIIRDYLHSHPELLVETLQEAREMEKRNKDAEVRATLVSERSELLDDPTSLVAGNPKGDVSIVEFFDYRCPYCKALQPSLDALIKQDAKLRIVYKEFPILGSASILAARIALAARKQGKYSVFHARMMATEGEAEITDQVVLGVAKASGLDLEKLRTDIQAPEVDAIIQRNYKVADELGIDGTPGIIVGDSIANGVADMATLKQMIAAARRAE
jgi:protein-disulfide isomerase